MLAAEEIERACKAVAESGLVVKTPLLTDMQHHFDLDIAIRLYLKLESTQRTGSFKIRGVVNQMKSLAETKTQQKLVTMSAGNYGRAFAFACKINGFSGTVVMPDFAPDDRQKVIEGLGASVVRAPADQTVALVDRLVKEQDAILMHPFDDHKLIAGHASAGIEILNDLPDPDVVVVCCGGGGLLAGIAAALRLFGPKSCRVYGVEPEGAAKMHESFRRGHPASTPHAKSIAAGLAPPYAGKTTYAICKQYVDDIMLVSDDEIKAAVAVLYSTGFVVEPSGAAAFAAVLANKVPLHADEKVVIVLTGRNVLPMDLQRIIESSCNT